MKNSDYLAAIFLSISIVLNVMIPLTFIFCQDRMARMDTITFVFFISFILFLFCAVPLSVHANKQGGSKLCRIYAVSFATFIASGIVLIVFSALFGSELLGYAALVLFVLSNVSGYAVVPFLQRKREFIFYLAAQSLSLCSFFGCFYIFISNIFA